MTSNKFDDIFGAARQNKPEPTVEPIEKSVAKPKAQSSKSSNQPAPTKSPWSQFEPQEKEPTVRLNVDISISMNDRLAEKARQYRIPKTELVRRLLEWSLDESSE